MNSCTRAVEAALIRRVIQRREWSLHGGSGAARPRAGTPFPTLPRLARPQAANWVDRVIAVTAIAVGLLVLGSYLQELMWAVLAIGATISLGSS